MPRVHHAGIRARDFERTLAFYRDGLGFDRVYRWSRPPAIERAAFLSGGGGTWIEIFDGGEDLGPPADGERSRGLFHVAIAFEDPKAAFDRAVAAGAEPIEQPVTRPLHGDPPIESTRGFVRGPDGETIELFRNDYLD